MRILVPLDGSPLAERALQPAATFLQHLTGDKTVILLRVVPYPQAVMDGPGFGAPPQFEQLLADTRTASLDYLREVAARPALAGLITECIAEAGEIAPTICEVAQRVAADFILLTSHGRTGFYHLALGSVAEAVGRDAHIPTVIVRATGSTFPEGTPLSILVTLDGTPLAETALDPAATLALAFHGIIHLLEVLPPEVDEVEHARDRANQAYAYLTVIHNRLEGLGIITHRSLAWGNPLHQIALEIDRSHIDLIAIATHGRSGLARIQHGSVARDIFHAIDRPMLILHPRDPHAMTDPVPAKALEIAP